MSQLHTVNSSSLLELCLRSMVKGDSLLLIEDGVYAAIKSGAVEMPAGVTLYALQNDLDARGLSSRISDKFKAVTETGFVRLCCEHEKVINWF